MSKLNSILRGAFLIGSFGLLCSLANAAPLTYHFTGTFTDGGTFSGQFDYDASTNTYSSVNVVTTMGSKNAGATYLVVLPGTPLDPTNAMEVTFLPNAGPPMGQDSLSFSFTPALTGSGPYNVTAGLLEAVCADATCFTVDPATGREQSTVTFDFFRYLSAGWFYSYLL